MAKQWMEHTEHMNEREDFYRQTVIDNSGPIPHVNLTAEDVQEAIDDPDPPRPLNTCGSLAVHQRHSYVQDGYELWCVGVDE